MMIFALPGCTISPGYRVGAARPLVNEPALVIGGNNQQAVRAAATAELGPSAAAAIPPDRHANGGVGLKRTEPVAVALINSMLERMQDRAVSADGFTHISLSELRNQSRCSANEFTTFRDRLADVFNQAGRDSHIQFSSAETAPGQPQYQMQGSAYVMTLDGFDVWELYLTLSPTVNPWTIWQANGPVHMLRQPRAGQAQMLP